MLELITDLDCLNDEQYAALQEMYVGLNEDEDQVCQQMNNGYYTGASTFGEWYQNRIQNGDAITVVLNKVGEMYVGFATYIYYPDDREVGLSMVYVKPAHRRQSYAKELLDYVMTQVKLLGAKGIYLTVLSPNIAAKTLYVQYGFTPAIEMHQRKL